MKRNHVFKRFMAALMIALLMAGSFGNVSKAKAAGGPTLRFHFHRASGEYDGWDVWLWESGKDGAGYELKEENGERIATMQVSAGCSSVGFIVRTAAWDKDIGEDQFIDIAEVVSGTVDVYVESGVKGYKKEYGSDVVLGIKVKNVKGHEDGSVRVEMTGQITEDLSSVFSLRSRDGDLTIKKVENIGGFEYKITIAEELINTHRYTLFYEGDGFIVNMPNVYSKPEFENQYTYTGNDLGATWTKEKTTFRVWAPLAENITVNLYKSGAEFANDLIEKIEMKEDVNGTWVAEKEGNLDGTYYTYGVLIDGKTVSTIDPYARTAGVDGKRGMIIDLDSTDPKGWDKDKNPNAGLSVNDFIIYEGHIRDLTESKSSNIKNAGKFLGLTETGVKTSFGAPVGIDHMKDLGITHLHILPMYDFGSVSESAGGYNWGYDPVNYNIPEGSYSTDPANGAVRVSEAKQMVQALHNNGISVVMDVVYNHVQNAATFSMNVLTPGYFSRISDDGVYSNGSGCGNDTASERSMVRKFIVDSVNYWVEEYHIDGFRFDLVGLIDVDTINEIVETVHKNHPDVFFYGEGWTMTTLVTKDVQLATQTNSTLTPGFAYFNDTIRDGLKGSVFDTGKGFVSGSAGDEAKIIRCFLGADRWCKSPAQTINYASCHDNNTLIDRLVISRSDASYEDCVKMNKLAAAIYLTSEGIPFMQAGEEMLRSKVNADGTFNSNSYNAGDSVNAIDYSKLNDSLTKDVYNYYKGLIAFRKYHPVLRLSTAEEVEKYVSKVAVNKEKLVVMSVNGGPEGEPSEAMYFIFNANADSVEVTLPDGQWTICANGNKAGTKSLGKASGTVKVDGTSAMILVKGGAEKSATTLIVILSVVFALLLIGIVVIVLLTASKKKRGAKAVAEGDAKVEKK